MENINSYWGIHDGALLLKHVDNLSKTPDLSAASGHQEIAAKTVKTLKGLRHFFTTQHSKLNKASFPIAWVAHSVMCSASGRDIFCV